MSHKSKMFIAEYVKTGNATEAAKKAGYSQKTAYSTGQRLLKNVEVMQEIERLQAEALKKAEVTVSEVVGLIKDIAVSGKSESNRLRAMDILLKYLGAYSDDFKIITKLTEDEVERISERLLSKINYE